MNTLNKTGQAAKVTHASILVRTGRALRTALFYTVHMTAWVAYFAWLLVPPIVWFSANPAHSRTATYWVGAIYLADVGLMTWSGYITHVGFRRWSTRGEVWAGWYAVGFAILILLAPLLPLLGLFALIGRAPPPTYDGYWWEDNFRKHG
jgi:hypothetical protein